MHSHILEIFHEDYIDALCHYLGDSYDELNSLFNMLYKDNKYTGFIHIIH